MTRKRRPAPPPPKGVMAGWTASRAGAVGMGAGLGAMLATILATVTFMPVFLYVLGAFLAVTFLCGLSILWITLWDMRTRGRGHRMRPIRAFDAAMGAALVLPAGYGLWLIAPLLGLKG